MMSSLSPWRLVRSRDGRGKDVCLSCRVVFVVVKVPGTLRITLSPKVYTDLDYQCSHTRLYGKMLSPTLRWLRTMSWKLAMAG